MLKIGDVTAEELVSRFKTPLYVYDEEKILEIIKKYKENFKSKKYDTQVIYASKAFACLYMYDLINKQNMGVDVVSGGELYGAIKVGFDPDNIFFHGNNKNDYEIKMALDYMVKNIVVDNLDELKMWIEEAKTIDYKLDVMFRINVGVSAHTHEYVVTAHPNSKFGFYIESDEIIEAINLIKKAKNIDFMGFHCHIGSQINDMEGFMITIEKLFGLMKKCQTDIKYLNLGGGFGVKYTSEDKSLKLDEVARVLVNKVDKEIEKSNIKIDKLFIEPGRSLIASPGYTLYTINKIKEAMNKRYYFIDGGMTDNIRPALYGAKYSCDIANKLSALKTEKVSIAGKCCESADVIIENVMLPKAKQDDILVVYTTGAYGYSMSSNYNKLPRPAIVFVDKNGAKEVVKRETYEFLYCNDVKGEY